MNIIEERRFGKFSIPVKYLEKCPNVIKEFMTGMIIFKAEMLFRSNSIEYEAAFELFQPVPEYNKTPEYELYIFKEPGDSRDIISHILFEFEI